MPPSGGLRKSFGIPDLDEETRKQAVAAAGPSWREWFYFEFLKVWIALGLLILDTWWALIFLEPPIYAVLIPSIVAIVYGEFLLYRYLWYRPDLEKASRGGFRRTYLRPVPYGRWTPEGWKARAGVDPLAGVATGPDPREFL